MNRKHRTAASTLLALALTGLAAPIASAAPPMGPSTPAVAVGAAQAEAATVLREVVAEHPSRFSDAELTGDRLTVHLTQAPNAALAADLAASPVPVDVKIDGRWTDREKRDAIAAATTGFYEIPGVGTGFATFDEARQAVVVSYVPGDGKLPADFSTRKANLTRNAQGKATNPRHGAVPVRFEVTNVAPPKPMLVSGGTQLIASDYSLACSAAFTGTRNGVPGILTADHCSGPRATFAGELTYEGNTPLTRVAEAGAFWGDAEFHTTTDTIRRDYVTSLDGAGQPQTAPLTGASYTDRGYMVCNWGWGDRNTSCARVIDTRVTANYAAPTGTTNNLVVTGTRSDGGSATAPGDSGGPWWLLNSVNTGVGITSGGGGYSGNGITCPANCSYYSDLISTTSVMGVTLKTD